MNDKYMQEDILEVMQRVAKSIDQIEKSIAEILDWQRNRTEMENEYERQKLMRASPAGFLANQFPRRDGDNYPTVKDGDRPTGNLRPLGVSGD